MKQRSNVRCFLPKSEATKLLVVFQQIEQAVVPSNSSAECHGTYNPIDDVSKSFEEAYRVIRERMAKGGPGWMPK